MRDELLAWYDANKRELPWRVDKPDPYHVMLSEFMLQQTTTTAVKSYYAKFLEKWPSVHDLAMADDDEVMQAWAGLGYYSRARNLLKAAREIDTMGAFPRDVEALKKLSGVGDYTAAAIASIAFGAPVLPIDGNVKRVLARYDCIDEPIDKPSQQMKASAQAWEGQARPGDLAQAFMDLGAMICRPKNPNCAACPIAQGCLAHQKDCVEEYPKRSPKRAKKQWQGHAYIIETPEGIAFEKREKGLLGDMYGLPSEMGEDVQFQPPVNADWHSLGDIEHVFTHIHLNLKLWYARLENAPLSNRWVYFDKKAQKGTASLWRKALKRYEERNG